MSRERGNNSAASPLHSPVANGGSEAVAGETLAFPYVFAEGRNMLLQEVQAEPRGRRPVASDVLKTVAAGGITGGVFAAGQAIATSSASLGMFAAGAATGGAGAIGYTLGQSIASTPPPTNEHAAGMYGWSIVFFTSGVASFATTLSPWMLVGASCGAGCFLGLVRGGWCAPSDNAIEVRARGVDALPATGVVADVPITREPMATAVALSRERSQ